MLTWLLEYWAADQLVKGYLEKHKYDEHGNLVSAWFNTWKDSSWIPMTYAGTGDGFTVIDGAGNYYSYIGYVFTLSYKLLSSSISVGIAPDNRTAPATPFLDQNYPNPFNPSTTIHYGLPQRSRVTLTVFNTLGQQVATLVEGDQEAGYHEVKFDACGLSSGVYFYRLSAGSYVQTRKLLLLR